MARRLELGTQPGIVADAQRAKWQGSLDANIIIANAPDPVFVSDLEGKIVQANDAVSQLLGFRQAEVLEQSLSRFISPEETREFTAALREVVERGVTRNARLNPRSASGEVIPTTLNASALRDPDGKVIGAIGILRDMRELDKARAYAESLIKNAPDPVFVSDLEGKILQSNDAVSALLGFRPDELLEQSLSRFISPQETREFTAALREVVERGVTRNAHLNPRSASGEVIPTTLNASALRPCGDAGAPPAEARRAAPRHAPHHGRPERVQQAARQPAEGHASYPRRLRARPPAPRPPDGTARQFAAGPAAHPARLPYGQAASGGQPQGHDPHHG